MKPIVTEITFIIVNINIPKMIVDIDKQISFDIIEEHATSLDTQKMLRAGVISNDQDYLAVHIENHPDYDKVIVQLDRGYLEYVTLPTKVFNDLPRYEYKEKKAI
ncbi:MAG: hypothetical protein COB85_08325 [Bacteroidetes bacterium]|nr:MAG: hypothetical protein COB85_08325 [Bacteroidota bacterium]